MHRTLEAALATIEASQAAEELALQVDALLAFGLAPTYLDCHMGPSSREGFEAVCRRFELPFLYPLLDPSLSFQSIAMMSPMPAGEKKPWLLDQLDGMEEGVHLIVTHPAIDSPELRSIARPDAENYVWTEPNRTSDLAVLLDDDVAERIKRNGIELISVGDL